MSVFLTLLVAGTAHLYICKMQTALHIKVLVAEAQKELVGGKLVSTAFYKKERSVYFHVRKDKSTRVLGFVYHPAGSGCFLVPASKIKIETREKPWPLLGITDGEVIAVRQQSLDRIFELKIKQDKRDIIFVIEAIGPHGNIWLLDDKSQKLGTLRKKTFEPGEPYTIPVPGERLNPFEFSPEQLTGLVDSLENDIVTAATLRTVIKKHLLGFNDRMAHEVIRRAGFEQFHDSSLANNDAAAIVQQIGQMASRFEADSGGYLYEFNRGIEIYPFRLGDNETQAEKFKSLSLATLAMVYRRHSTAIGDDRQKNVIKTVTKSIRRFQKRLVKLDVDVSRAADFEKYKRHAELLQINRDRLKKGMTQVEVVDLIGDTDVKVIIKLDPALPPNDNIERLFQSHRKGREGLALLERRREVSDQELQSLKFMLGELEKDFDSAEQRYETELISLMPREKSSEAATPRLPYRETILSTGVTIFVGRDGSDNDRTTFEFARPYELWFHTQQCPGSHVVIKFPSKSFEPSKREIEETAAIAAWHSRARNDSLVPVIYTQRKYVRKPRKAKPGLVTVEREKSVMVQPRKPDK